MRLRQRQEATAFDKCDALAVACPSWLFGPLHAQLCCVAVALDYARHHHRRGSSIMAVFRHYGVERCVYKREEN